MHAHRLKVHIPENRELRLLLPADVVPGEAEVIVLEVKGQAGETRNCKYTAEEFLAARLVPPAGTVTLADMETAIAKGAIGRGGV